jgi:hypothetical protein
MLEYLVKVQHVMVLISLGIIISLRDQKKTTPDIFAKYYCVIIIKL